MLLRVTFAAATLIALVLACEPPPERSPELEIGLLGCVDEPQPWDTCAEFCAWDGAVCAEQACEGTTSRSYASQNACLGGTDDDPFPAFVDSPYGCEDELVFDELDRRYYNCCCDYR